MNIITEFNNHLGIFLLIHFISGYLPFVFYVLKDDIEHNRKILHFFPRNDGDVVLFFLLMFGGIFSLIVILASFFIDYVFHKVFLKIKLPTINNPFYKEGK